MKPDDGSRKVAVQAFGTKVLAVFATHGLGTVVVPGDIAYTCGAEGALQGKAHRDEFEWVGVRDEDGQTAVHDVYVTFRTDLEPVPICRSSATS